MSEDETGTTNQPPIELQREFWNEWNLRYRSGDFKLSGVNLRQAEIVTEWIEQLNRNNLEILDVGCGSGWLCERMQGFGNITGTDLANDVLEHTASILPNVKFIPGDFMALDFRDESFDVIVTLEVFSHVLNQEAFLQKLWRILRPGGILLFATQNRFVLSRHQVQAQAPGQLRHWVNSGELRHMVKKYFSILEFTSIEPSGHNGILRLVNSPKLNKFLSIVIRENTIKKFKEKLFLGHTLMLKARKLAKNDPELLSK